MADVSRFGSLRKTVAEVRSLLNTFVARGGRSPKLEGARPPQHKRDAAYMIAALDRRASLFGSDSEFFGDPAWTMLLELYVAKSRNKRLSVSDAATRSRMPPTTGLRYLALLEQRDLIRREDDPRDEQRSFVFLTDETEARISEWLSYV